MNLQQLRIFRETIRQGFNLTEVADALFTSQPGVSKHIKDLEDELGVELFQRKGKRLLGLTGPGRELCPFVDEILLSIQNIRTVADQFSNRETGHFVIATTHTQARYALPEIIRWFKYNYPKVHLTLHQGSPREIAEMLVAGEADVGMATESLDSFPELASFACYEWHHALIVPAGHPLLAEKSITLENLAAYPIITYHEGFTGRSKIDQTFAKAGIKPDVVLSAIDADVIKTYVNLGLGVGIIASMAFSSEADQQLKLIPVPDLFPANVTRLAVRKGAHLRAYAYALIEKICPELEEEVVRQATNSLKPTSQ